MSSRETSWPRYESMEICTIDGFSYHSQTAPLYDLTVIDPAPGLVKGLRHKGSACCATPVITTKS
jgi:hypothetical protein